ncbi:unnamed protein product [Effrenium voratum]|uniref:Ubiquitin-like domain-containing protein n=2 Tax=Effrenium voratum TaxID=2562239 RepID=A0AA36I756_9DINO|nr:unnamed protein product [Effrenium voratum]
MRKPSGCVLLLRDRNIACGRGPCFVVCSLPPTMAMKVSVQQLSGNTIILEGKPEMTVGEFERQIKESQDWDELTRQTTVAEVVLEGHKLLDKDATLVEVGLSSASNVLVIWRKKRVRPSRREKLGNIDLD